MLSLHEIFFEGFVWFLLYIRNIEDLDRTMDEVNEQTENMKQIQEALSMPIGAAADFDEVATLKVTQLIFKQLLDRILVAKVNSDCYIRMNWKRSLKNWKGLSWRTSFSSQPRLLLPLQCTLLQSSSRQILVQWRTRLRMMSSLPCRQKWLCREVIP